MADLDEVGRKRQERHNLLIALKETVEGILAIGSTNVWSTYGGLSRLCRGVENILIHRLRKIKGSDAVCLDYWSYVRGLRWLNPVLAPTIERISRMAKNDPDDLTCGQLWIRQCLLDHSLSIQLTILVENTQHLEEHYTHDAFLCSKEYYGAMLICLQAVEQNKAALLAEINPSLLKLKQKKISHVRSASLPVNKPSTPAIMIRRKSSLDPLAPSFTSPKRDENFLSTSDEHARPTSRGSSPEDGKITAKSQLLSVLEKSGDIAEIETTNDELNWNVDRGQDPLLNIEVSKTKKLVPERRKLSIDESREFGYEKRYRRSSSVRSDGKNSELLDKILNNDSDITEESDSSDDVTKQNGRLSVSTSRTNLLRCNYSSSSLINSERGRGSQDSLDVDLEDIGNQKGNDSDITKSHRHKMESAIAKKKSKKTHKRSKSDHLLGQAIGSPPHSQEAVDIDGTHGLSSSLPLKIVGDDDTYFPRPRQGQSLRSFLASQDFHTCAELDKENAHFSISEALIAAIEQMKWNHVIKPHVVSDIDEGDSDDDEIRELQQRIRIRRREKLREKARVLPSSDGRTDTTTSTSPSVNQDAMAWTDSMDSSELEEQDIDIHVDDRASPTTNLTALKDTGLSLSLGSLYSEAELQKTAANKPVYVENKPLGSSFESSCVSAAELVAINLLKKFSDNQLPKASDLEWLVSETDVPQALLPLPDSFPISPDDGERELTTKTRIRGNLEWAPPRAQIIFNIHPPPKRKVLLAKQNYRCTGCGTKVDQGYTKRLRYCEYLGKFFCQCCHSNTIFFIPGRILRKWDFSKYTVSNFSHDLLTKMYADPLFNISDINSALYRKVRALEMIRECRVQLYHIYLFIKTCRLASGILNDLHRLPSHWISEPELYSLSDLVKVKNSEILPHLRNLVTDSVCHISGCQLCQAKGFICELCNNETDVIFPFELNRVAQCRVCGACYHGSCFVPENCPKCARIQLRRKRLSVVALSSPEESEPDSPQHAVVEPKKS
ncbi:run domain Beclin-1-interacting and cysteine-rich domain-containing protein-like [Lineus longissimus]|uniref:run domain Beclin-1-interacting and cysteine-rich domain-containing protein-like n=1 Tax=Lineus longissimus TaxID=88925 RepID=UPI002B4D8DF8